MRTPFTWLLRNFAYVGCAGFLALYIWSIHRGNVMVERGKHTVGYVTGWTQTAKSGRSIDYRCVIGGVTYKSSALERQGMNSTVGTRYLVEYDSLDPSVNNAYYDHPLLNGVDRVPFNGWTKKFFRAYEDSLREHKRE